MTTLPEVSEDEAEGKIKAIFDDVKATLEIPRAGFLFRRLAVYPWYLQLAWRNLKPNAATVYFHRTADELRSMALDFMSRDTQTGGGQTGDADLSQQLDTLLDLHAKLFLAGGALAVGANGQLPKMRLISQKDRQTTTPQSVPSMDMGQMKAQQVSAQQQSIMDDFQNAGTWMQGDEDLQMLAPWTADLSPRWSSVKEMAATAEFQGHTRKLREMVLGAVEGFPFRMEISATAARRAGLSEDQIDAVRSIVNDAVASLPAVVLSLAALSPGTSGSTAMAPDISVAASA